MSSMSRNFALFGLANVSGFLPFCHSEWLSFSGGGLPVINSINTNST